MVRLFSRLQYTMHKPCQLSNLLRNLGALPIFIDNPARLTNAAHLIGAARRRSAPIWEYHHYTHTLYQQAQKKASHWLAFFALSLIRD